VRGLIKKQDSVATINKDLQRRSSAGLRPAGATKNLRFFGYPAVGASGPHIISSIAGRNHRWRTDTKPIDLVFVAVSLERQWSPAVSNDYYRDRQSFAELSASLGCPVPGVSLAETGPQVLMSLQMRDSILARQ
jgi:hypothetical protein